LLSLPKNSLYFIHIFYEKGAKDMPEYPQHRYGPSQTPYQALALHVHKYPIRYALRGACPAPLKDGTTSCWQARRASTLRIRASHSERMGSHLENTLSVMRTKVYYKE
jgi:hypothetical protein